MAFGICAVYVVGILASGSSYLRFHIDVEFNSALPWRFEIDLGAAALVL